jgi:hypothetical protein
MFLANIHAAGIGDGAVDHGDLPVISIANRM